MKRMILLSYFLASLVVFFLLVNQIYSISVASEIPLPSDINIVAPDPSLPEEFQAISGKWRGHWGGSGMETILIIEKIDRHVAEVIFATGDIVPGGFMAGSGSKKGGWSRTKYKVNYNAGEIILEREGIPGQRDAIKFTFKKDKPDILEGFLIRSGYVTGGAGRVLPTYEIRMKKIK